MQLTEAQLFEIVFTAGSGAISLLLFGNLFFLKRAIRKIDNIDTLTASVDAIVGRLDKLCEQMELVHELRIEVATLKTRLSGLYYRRANGHDDDDDDEGKRYS